MTIHKVREFNLELLDEIHELSQDLVGDPEAVRTKVVAFHETRGAI